MKSRFAARGAESAPTWVTVLAAAGTVAADADVNAVPLRPPTVSASPAIAIFVRILAPLSPGALPP